MQTIDMSSCVDYCVPTALAFLSGSSKRDALNALVRSRAKLDGVNYPRPRRGWPFQEYIPAARDLRISLGEVQFFTKKENGKCPKLKELSQTEFNYLLTGTWMLSSLNHLYVLKDGVIYDTFHPNGTPIADSKKNFKIVRGWKVNVK